MSLHRQNYRTTIMSQEGHLPPHMTSWLSQCSHNIALPAEFLMMPSWNCVRQLIVVSAQCMLAGGFWLL